MINGLNYNLRSVSSKQDRQAFYAMNRFCDIVTRGCELSRSDSAIYVGHGDFICRGGHIEIQGDDTSVAIPGSITGTTYFSLVFEVDLSQPPSDESFTQGSFKLINGGTSFPSLIQEDLDDDGDIYQMLFADFIMSSGGITEFIDMRPTVDRTIEFKAINWVDDGTGSYTQTVRCSGVSEDSDPLWEAYFLGLTHAEAELENDSVVCLNYITCGNNTVTGHCIVSSPLYDFKIKIGR